MEQLRVGRNRLQTPIEFKLARDRNSSWSLQLCLKKLRNTPQQFIHLHRLQLRMWHFGEFAEASNDRFQIRYLRQQRARTLAKYFVELFRILHPGANQILDCELQREQRILQLMRQSPRQLAPRSNALGSVPAVLFALVVPRSCD